MGKRGMANTLLQQGKTAQWMVDENGAALVTSGEASITNYDSVSDLLAYVGKAAPGSASSSASWQIKRLTYTSAGDVTTAVADGNLNYDNVWDNRASLTYS